jgi:hypothetical protein
MVFECALGTIKPKFPPVAPFIAGTRDQLNDLHRSLARLRRKHARSKLSNLISNFPFLPVQTIILCEHFDRGLPAVRSRCPDVLRQSHHGIGRQLVDLDVEPSQNFSHKSMCGQTKSGSEKSLEHNQFAFRLGDLLCPRDTCHSAAEITKLLHVLHADRGHPRHAELHCVTDAQLLRRHSAQRLLDDAPAGGVAAAEEEEDDIATYRRRRRAVCFTRARSPTSKNKEGKRAASDLRRRLRFSRNEER